MFQPKMNILSVDHETIKVNHKRYSQSSQTVHLYIVLFRNASVCSRPSLHTEPFCHNNLHCRLFMEIT